MEVMPSTKQTAEFAAEPRPWQRMPFERAKRTMEFDRQEVRRVAHVLDQVELVPQLRRDIVRQASG